MTFRPSSLVLALAITFARVAAVTAGTNAPSSGGSLHESDMIGTWKVAPSTFSFHSYITPNAFTPALPTNCYEFSLTLRSDGLFEATNVPQGFLHRSTSTSKLQGIWTLRYDANQPPLSKPPTSTGITTRVDYSIGLVIRLPGPNSLAYCHLPLTLFQTNASSPQIPAICIYPIEEKSSSYDWGVLVTKQQARELTNSFKTHPSNHSLEGASQNNH
jgi:hypothetical protein